MSKFIRAARGYVSMGVGLVACPCHLPLTLPLILSLTAGTAFSAWLAANMALVYGFSTLIFIGGLAMGLFWLNTPTQPAAQRELGSLQTRPGRASQTTSNDLHPH